MRRALLPLLLALCAACGDTTAALNDPDATSPDATQPDLNEPDATSPDAAEPDLTEPDAAEPDATEPDLTEPDATEPDADASDLAEPDADEPDVMEPDMEPDIEPDELHPALYTADRTLSPLTPSVAQNLREVMARDPGWNDHVFAKVGASSTVSSSFLHCFAGGNIDLGGRDELQATIDHFAAGYADGTTPFDRESLTTVVGWSAVSALAGDPSPLERELAAIEPRFAVIMYGTNDVERRNIEEYATNLLDMADLLLARGIIPIFSTFMPRDDKPSSDLLVPNYNAVVRAVAQGRQIPMVDLHRELLPLPDHGLSGDNLHPSTYRLNGANRACHLTPEGLQYGYNIRNLITIQTLDRLRRVLLDDELAPDPPGPALQGDGSPNSPFEITHLPFVDLRDTRDSPHERLSSYTGCAASQDESGPEWLYRLEVERPARLTARVFDRGQVDVDLHLLRGEPEEGACFARAHQEIEAELTPGVWYLAVDTFVSRQSGAQGGEYLLTVLLDE